MSPTASNADRPTHILTLSASDERTLDDLIRQYRQHLTDRPDTNFPDLCFTAATTRPQLEHRLAVIAQTTEDARNKLAELDAGGSPPNVFRSNISHQQPPDIVFMFTGQGSQSVGMGQQLYNTDTTFRSALDQCDRFLRPHLETPLLDVLYPPQDRTSPLGQTAYAQPALFALEYALARLWQSWNINPSAMLGHSVGEYVAACIAGIFPLQDALRLVAERARLMQSLPPGGAMAAVFADERRVTDIIAPLADRISIAAVNSPQQTVISGQADALQAVLDQLQTAGINAQRLVVSHAFHSPLVEPIQNDFERAARNVPYAPPDIPIVSNVTGQLARDCEMTNPDYWRNHIRQPVRFAPSIRTLIDRGYKCFLEVGPHPVLTGLGIACEPAQDIYWLPSLRRGKDDWTIITWSLASLYATGTSIDWPAFDHHYPRHRISLPTSSS